MNVDRVTVAVGSEVNEDGWIGIQPLPVGGKEGSTYPYQTLHPFGFISRPSDPEVDEEGMPTKGCEVLVLHDGDEGFALPLSDDRSISKLVALQKGDSCAYSSGAAFSRWGANGTISHFVTIDNTYEGRSVTYTQNGDGFDLSCPWGRITMGKYGIHLVHSSGARLDLGAIAAPAPLDALGSYATISAAMVNVKGTMVSVGTDGGLNNFAAVQALKLFATTVGATVASLVPASGAVGAQQAVVASALTALLLVIDNLGKDV